MSFCTWFRHSAAILATAIFCAPAGADTVAYWNFNSGNTGTAGSQWPGPIVADQGSGSIIMSGWTGATDAFSGTVLNTLNDDPAGSALVLTGDTGNGSYIEVQFSMTGLADLGVSFATRGTSTGFNLGQWSYSTDGVSFTNFGANTASTSTSYSVAGPITTSALDNAPNAFLRYTLDGATSVTGNNRIDNLLLETNAEPPPPPPDPRLPLPGDVVFGLNSSDADVTLELVHGSAVVDGGTRNPGPWHSTPFIQSVEFDNHAGQTHNARGNLLGLDFGASATGGLIYSFATQGSIPAPPGQLIGNTRPAPDNIGHDGSLTQTRIASVSVSPDNSKIALIGSDAGTVIVYDYTPGDTMGTGAALANGRQTPDATSGLNIMVAGSTQGTVWRDNSTVLAFSSIGDLYEVNPSTMATTLRTTVSTDGSSGTPFVGSNYSALAYNPEVSPYLYALYSGFSGTSVTHLYVLDPANNYAQLIDIDLSATSETGREMALDADGNLFISGFSSTIDFIPASAVLNPLTLTDNSSIDWYSSITSSSFVGMDIGFGEVGELLGDHNGDGRVDAADYVVWRKNPAAFGGAQGYTDWVNNFGETSGSGSGSGLAAVPEPASAVLLFLGLATLCGRRRTG